MKVVEYGNDDQVVMAAGDGRDGLVGQPGGLALGYAGVAHPVELLPPVVHLGCGRAGEAALMKGAVERLELIADGVFCRSCRLGGR